MAESGTKYYWRPYQYPCSSTLESYVDSDRLGAGTKRKGPKTRNVPGIRFLKRVFLFMMLCYVFLCVYYIRYTMENVLPYHLLQDSSGFIHTGKHFVRSVQTFEAISEPNPDGQSLDVRHNEAQSVKSSNTVNSENKNEKTRENSLQDARVQAKTSKNNKFSLTITNSTDLFYPSTLNSSNLMQNNSFCSSVKNLSIIVIVHSLPQNFDKRAGIRRTWGNNNYFKHLGTVKVLFLLGRAEDKETEKELQDEFRKQGDLLQGNFIDTRKNNTNKGVMGYKWISEYCRHAQMLLKVNDDILVDTYKLLKQFLPTFRSRNHYILCNHILSDKMRIVRDKNSNWYVSENYFPGQTFYPEYCSGFAVMMSLDIFPAIYAAASATPYFWVDDVYLYGLLPTKVGNVNYVRLNEGNFSLNNQQAVDCFNKKGSSCPLLIAGDIGTGNEFDLLWEAVSRTNSIDNVQKNRNVGIGKNQEQVVVPSNSSTDSDGKIDWKISPFKTSFIKITNSSQLFYPVTINASYLIQNKTLCTSDLNLSVLVLVHTEPTHFDRRDGIRRTWTNNKYFSHLGTVRVLFLLGRVAQNETLTQKKIENEFRIHGDILQGDFMDDYHNLTHKGVMGYRWVSENCRHAQMLLKVNDDILVDTKKLLQQLLPIFRNKKRYILCNHILSGKMKIIRDKNSKWYVDANYFPGRTFYPDYCSGFAVMMSLDILPAIYTAASATPFFWVDDVYLYGLLPEKVGNINYIRLNEGNFSLNYQHALECFNKKRSPCQLLIAGGVLRGNEFDRLWEAVSRPSKLKFIDITNSSKVFYPVTVNATYLIQNKTLCTSVSNLSALVIVHTAPKHFDRRDGMRRTWTNNEYFNHLGTVRVLFLLGKVAQNETILQKKIEEEFRMYGDILQGNFIDDYHNLTHKGVMGYKWVSEYCKNAQMLVKVDDDVMVNTYTLLSKYLPQFKSRKRYVFCNHIPESSMPIIRKKNTKWFVSETYFPGRKYYPEYCSGFAVMMSLDIVPAIYKAAYTTPFFWVDDVYLYGLLPGQVANVTYIKYKEGVFALSYKKALRCFNNHTTPCPMLVAGGVGNQIDYLWESMGRSFAIANSGKVHPPVQALLSNNQTLQRSSYRNLTSSDRSIFNIRLKRFTESWVKVKSNNSKAFVANQALSRDDLEKLHLIPPGFKYKNVPNT